MTIIERLDAALFGAKKCGDIHPKSETCQLGPGHFGFHKSHSHAWPNARDSMDEWARIGRQIMLGAPSPPMSLRELEYAIAAATTADTAPTPEHDAPHE